MASSKTAKRRRRHARKTNADLVDAIANPPELVPEPDPPLEVFAEQPEKQEEAEPAPTTVAPEGIRVVVKIGDETREISYGGQSSIAEAAETAVSKVIGEMASAGRWPLHPVMATCYTAGAQFGPFVVDISLVVDAAVLRGTNAS